MAPTRTEIDNQLKAVVDLIEEVRLAGSVTSGANVVDLEDVIVQAAEGKFSAQLLAAVGQLRARYSSVLGADANILRWILRTYMVLIGSEATSDQAMLDALYQDFVDNSITVKERGYTLATPGSFTGTGNGTLYRLTVDANNHTFEHGIADTKTAKIIRDQSNGALIHEEVCKLRGATIGLDALDEAGSGKSINLQGLTYRSVGAGGSPLQNGGFRQLASATAPTASTPQTLTAAPTGWEITSGAFTNMETQIDKVARVMSGETSPTALRWTAANTMRQLMRTNRINLRPNIPYLCGAYLARENSADGNAVITLGGSSVTQALTSLTNDVFTFVPIAMGTGLWFENFNAVDLDIELDWTSRTTGDLIWSEVILAPGTFFDGSWYWLVGGTTEFLKDDEVSFTDTDGGTGKIQGAFSRAFAYRTLPHAAAPTLADP